MVYVVGAGRMVASVDIRRKREVDETDSWVI
jgi:hypothetical protein